MERLWAPWRMEYILRERENGCFLCDIIHRDDDRGDLVLRRLNYCVLLMNRYPYNNGHLMAVPYRHVDSLESMAEYELSELMSVSSTACAVLRTAVNAEGFNLGLNIGEAAGAGLKDHVHLHIVPRWRGDTNFMPVVSGTKVIPQSLEDLWEEICEALKERSCARN